MFHRSSLRPINRIKHVVDVEGTATSTISITDLIKSTDAPLLANTNAVETGSTVNGIYLHVEVSHTSGTGRPNIYLAIMKNPGNNLASPDPSAIGSNDNKRYIIHQEMIMMSGDAGNGLPRPIFNGVIKIPKGYRRNGPDDSLRMLLITKGSVQADFCAQCHYKEFR